MTILPSPITTAAVPQAITSLCDDVLLAGLITGSISVHKLGKQFEATDSETETKEMTATTIDAGKGSIRAILQSSATAVVCALSEGGLSRIDLSEGKVVKNWAPPKKEQQPTALLGFSDTDGDNCMVGFVGTDEGGVLGVDLRAPNPSREVLEQGDYVCGLAYVPGTERQGVVAASGDGMIGLYDTRNTAMKLAGLSAPYDDDLLCLAVESHSNIDTERSPFIVSGTLEGALHVFDAGELKSAVDKTERNLSVNRMRGHPDSVNALAFKSGALITGCADGLVRVVEPTSGELLGILEFDRSWIKNGQDKRELENTWPVETMCIVDGTLALAGHEECIRFASLDILDEENEDEDEEKDTSNLTLPSKKDQVEWRKNRTKKTKRSNEVKRQKDDDTFFGDL